MRKDRLLKLADFLETVPPESFDMKDWQTSAPTRPEGERQGDCGFAGCAMGWAAHGGLFRGLTIVDTVIQYRGFGGFHAADELFEFAAIGPFNSNDSDHLFCPSRYSGKPTPKEVAERIRKFVAEKSPKRTK